MAAASPNAMRVALPGGEFLPADRRGQTEAARAGRTRRVTFLNGSDPSFANAFEVPQGFRDRLFAENWSMPRAAYERVLAEVSAWSLRQPGGLDEAERLTPTSRRRAIEILPRVEPPHEASLVHGVAGRSIGDVRIRPVVAARHLDADAAAMMEEHHSCQ